MSLLIESARRRPLKRAAWPSSAEGRHRGCCPRPCGWRVSEYARRRRCSGRRRGQAHACAVCEGARSVAPNRCPDVPGQRHGIPSRMARGGMFLPPGCASSSTRGGGCGVHTGAAWRVGARAGRGNTPPVLGKVVLGKVVTRAGQAFQMPGRGHALVFLFRRAHCVAFLQLRAHSRMWSAVGTWSPGRVGGKRGGSRR